MADRVIVLDGGTGNVRSIEKALQHLGCQVAITQDSKDIQQADRIVLPGQGSFQDCINGLKKIHEPLCRAIFEDKKPYLGICIGMQVLMEYGVENKTTAGWGWVSGRCLRLSSQEQFLDQDRDQGRDQGRKCTIPHMGWNKLAWKTDHPITQQCQDIAYAYFAHSYYCEVSNDAVLAQCHYGNVFPAVIAKDNLLAVQFHPEKSQEAGLHFLEAFLQWQP